jgi:hypothetical protein
MNTQNYDLWLKSRQKPPEGIDLVDATMASIRQSKQTWLARACEFCLSYPMNCWLKGCILASGALTGLLRMVLFVYYALFV